MEEFCITFTHPLPVQRQPSVHLPQTTTKKARSVIDLEVRALLAKKAIKHCHGSGFVSRLFTIPKKTGGIRPVLNLQPMNQFTKHQSFKMKTIQQTKLGFLYNVSKSQLTPTQQQDHLGFDINTQTMCLSIPPQKVRDLCRDALRLQKTKTCSLRHLSLFIGMAQATTPAVSPASLHTRKLLQLENQALAQGLLWTSPVRLTTSAVDDLHWWIHHLNEWNGLSFIPETSTQEVFIDASDQGWGIIYNNHTLKGL
ncbi:hypothetical protein [Parasitella parasitica]|uniref:Uncharacterized protein n=1 Tax=Parasitella parasitica TaxID=35722 RepID=A0A0B7MMN0_9FUNG|nr:hypothetical protein [Parasitella parasitica]